MIKKHKILTICVIVVVIIGVSIFISYNVINSGLKKFVAMEIHNVDITKVADGSYDGSFKQFPVEVEVKVTLKNHEIVEIEIVKHDNGQGTKAEIITDKVIEAQTLEVDVITGATYSSKAILKAIENALISANV